MKLADIQRRETTKEERRAIRAEYNSWRRGDIEINGWSWKRWRKKAYRRQRGRCHYCSERKSLRSMQVDHRVAVFYGGPNHLSNFILACGACNRFKAQHVLLRSSDRASHVLKKAEIVRPQRVDYAAQERAFAGALNAIMDDQMFAVIERD